MAEEKRKKKAPLEQLSSASPLTLREERGRFVESTSLV